MANPSVLTPVGFDTPQLQYAVTPQVAQALQPDSSPDTTGLNILGEANKSFQATNQAQVQSYQIQADALNNIQKAQVASAQAIGQAEQVNFQATAASGASSLQSWARAIDNIGGVVEKATKAAEARRLAELKAELDRNQISSTTELENLQIDWIEKGRINKEGTAAYRRAVGEILAKRPLQADTISTLTTKYYSPALDHAKQQDNLVFQEAQKAGALNRDIATKQFKMSLITATAGLEQSAYLQDGGEQPYLDTINTRIKEIYDSKDLDALTKAQIVSEAFDPILKSASVRAETKAVLGRIQAGSAAVANYITQNGPKVLDGTLPQSTFNEEANQIRRSYGLPAENDTPPDINLQRTVKNLETNQKLDALNKQGIINDAERMSGDENFVKSIGLQLFLNPASLLLMKNSKPEDLDKNAKAGLALAQEANEFFGKTSAEYREKIQKLNTRMAEVSKGDYKSMIEMLNRANSDNTAASLAASLRGLGLGMPTAPPGSSGPTEEQINFMRANSEDVLRAIKAEADPLTKAYLDKRDELNKMGFFDDKRESQKHLKALDTVTEAYNKRLEDARVKRLQMLTPPTPGQSPNFNGGSLGVQVPLTRRSFRGINNVTMPFPVGDANNMADAPPASGAMWGGAFHDARPGRLHDGVDFPVPKGTPVLSLVYGTISEVRTWDGKSTGYGNAVAVKGDDGKEYFFAHLDKSHVAVGQRVGPGEKVGLSGDSGAPGGEHLHMEVLVDGKTIDPLQVLSTGNFGQQPKMPRSSGVMQGVPQGQVQIDPRAIPVGGGNFIIEGKIVKFSPDYSDSKALQQNMVDIKGLKTWSPSPEIHDIKLKPGLEVIGYKALPIDSSVKPGDPVGYYTLRNAAGGVLIQTAYQKKDGKKMLQDFGFDGKGYTPPRATEPPPVSPTKVDPSKAGRVLLQRTGQRDEHGLEIISVSMFDSRGMNVGSYSVNTGKPAMQDVFGSGGTTVPGSGAPLEYGSYNIGAPEDAADIPGMRSDFIPITPTFKTKRSLLGIHFDGDRNVDPGSMGCIVFKSKQEFDTFKSSLTSSSISRLDFTKGVTGGVQVVSQAPTPTTPTAPTLKANKEGQRLATYLSNPNVTAFLDSIANAEGLHGKPGGGYDLGFGYRKINSLADHPYSGSELTPQGQSSASGRFQFMGHTWGDMKKALGLTDFSPVSQQVAALKQLDQLGVLDKIAKGQVDDGVLVAAAGVWASLETAPGTNRSRYGGNVVTPGGTYANFRSFWQQQRGKQTSQPIQPMQPAQDPAKIPIGGGKFMLRGKIVSTNYTPTQPLEQSYASASKHEDPGGGEDAYGYAQLKRDPSILSAVENIAKVTEIPPQWIADVAALYGTAGIDKGELTEIADKLKGRRVDTPTDLVALVLGDGSKVTDLGVHVGRRYDSQFSRFARTTARVHTAISPDCRMCGLLQAQTQFIPHRAEVA